MAVTRGTDGNTGGKIEEQVVVNIVNPEIPGFFND
jgi:hypothetical protein